MLSVDSKFFSSVRLTFGSLPQKFPVLGICVTGGCLLTRSDTQGLMTSLPPFPGAIPPPDGVTPNLTDPQGHFVVLWPVYLSLILLPPTLLLPLRLYIRLFMIRKVNFVDCKNTSFRPVKFIPADRPTQILLLRLGCVHCCPRSMRL